MPLPVVTTQIVPGRSSTTLLARIVGGSNIPITQGTVTSISIVVTDVTLEKVLAGSGAIATHTASVSSTVFNSLQTDAIWTKDTALQPGPDGLAGYNFRYTLPAVDFANSGDDFEADAVITMANGDAFRVPFTWKSRKVYG